MDRIGERLRRRREELGFTVEDIAEATRFRPEVVRAVEEGRAGVFPADAYLKAFLRAYATQLGLDPQETIREQKSEEERVQEAIKGIRVSPRRRTNPRRTLLWFGIIVVVAAGVLVLYDRVLRGRDPGATDRPVRGTAPFESDSVGADGLIDDEDAHEGAETDPEEDYQPETGPSPEVDTPPEGSGESATGTEPYAGAGDVKDMNAGSSPDVARSPARPVMQEGPPEKPDRLAGQTSRDDVAAVSAGPETEETLPQDRTMRDADGSPDWISVSISQGAPYVRLISGGGVLLDSILAPGYRDTFYSTDAFVFEHITDKKGVSLLYNGRRVGLPQTTDRSISNFRVPSADE